MGVPNLRKGQQAAHVLIADGHQLLADACKSLLEPEFQVVGIVLDGLKLADAVNELKPDVILLNIYLPGLSGLDAAKQVKERNPKIKLVFLSETLAADVAAEAFHCGASGYVSKQSAGSELLFAVRCVNRGKSYLSPLVEKEKVTFLLNKTRLVTHEKKFTPRQSQILKLLADGQSMKQIAILIDVKPSTVAFHKYRIMETLEIETNAGLLCYAIKRQPIASQR